MTLKQVVERILYGLLVVLSLIALGLVANSEAAENFMTIHAVYQGF